MDRPVSPQGEPEEPPVIRDRRRIDPNTGQVRATGSPTGASPSGPDPAVGGPDAVPTPSEELAEAQLKQAALVEDLRRLKAEYVNYKRRVDRDRDVARERAVVGVLEQLLPVLDDIDRAREHGQLEGGFKAVADSLDAVTTRLGLSRYGEVGEPFDPSVHEALMHSHDDSVTEPTCVQVLFAGYRVGERVLRPARVAVAEPVDTPDGPGQPDAATGGSDQAVSDPDVSGPDVSGQNGEDNDE